MRHVLKKRLLALVQCLIESFLEEGSLGKGDHPMEP